MERVPRSQETKEEGGSMRLIWPMMENDGLKWAETKKCSVFRGRYSGAAFEGIWDVEFGNLGLPVLFLAQCGTLSESFVRTPPVAKESGMCWQ